MAEHGSTAGTIEKSHDTLFDGRLHCVQHAEGYRFSIDPVLLAHFVRLTKDETVCDLGCGSGILGLILLYRSGAKIRSLTGLELQEQLVQLARENIVLNGFQEKMNIVQGDLRTILKHLAPESQSTVVCNPPFYESGRGRSSLHEEALIARHQVACSLEEILAAAGAIVRNRGRVFMIYPAEGVGTLLGRLPAQRLTLKRMQTVYSYPAPAANARLVLIEAMKNGGEGAVLEPPLYIYDEKDGAYSSAMEAMYDGGQQIEDRADAR